MPSQLAMDLGIPQVCSENPVVNIIKQFLPAVRGWNNPHLSLGDRELHLLSQTEAYLKLVLWVSSYPQVAVLSTGNPSTILICLCTLLKHLGNCHYEHPSLFLFD